MHDATDKAYLSTRPWFVRIEVVILPFWQYHVIVHLDMLKPMAMRQYSIASSPIADKNVSATHQVANLIYDVH